MNVLPIVDMLYIFRFLHQTTTICWLCSWVKGCISFVSYIKPQQFVLRSHSTCVVYLSFPTSNHNLSCHISEHVTLYIFRFLHQTTTTYRIILQVCQLYIFRFLHQTTTCNGLWQCKSVLYIFRFLHQTTTYCRMASSCRCCISFVSYIKPQQKWIICFLCHVVYLSFPTSNHNFLEVAVMCM